MTSTETKFNFKNLNDNVGLVAITRHRWDGKYNLPTTRSALSFEGEEVESDNITAPTTKFFTKSSPVDEHDEPWKKQFDAVYSKALRIVNKFTIPFVVRSLRWLPTANEAEFVDQIQSCQTELSDLVEQFRNQYDYAKDQVKENVPEAIWNFISPKLPDKNMLASRFGINILPMHIAPPEENITMSDLRARHEVINNSIRNAVENSLEDIIREPRKELAKTIRAVNETIESGGRLNVRSFNAVTTAITKLRAFNFMADSDVEETLQLVENNINDHTPKEIMEDSDIKTAFSNMLKDTADTLSDEMRIADDIETFGRSMRVLDLD